MQCSFNRSILLARMHILCFYFVGQIYANVSSIQNHSTLTIELRLFRTNLLNVPFSMEVDLPAVAHSIEISTMFYICTCYVLVGQRCSHSESAQTEYSVYTFLQTVKQN